MEIKQFIKMLHYNNAIRLNEEYILFNDLELYNFTTQLSIQFQTIEDLLAFEFLGESLKEFIEDTDEFYTTIDGGRGAGSSEKMGGGFNHADNRGNGENGKVKFPAEFNVGGKNRSYEKTLDLFKSKYAASDHEYGITVDEQGFVHRHIEGGSTSVAISGTKGQMILHNHPGGGNFSDSDLISVSSGQERGIVAVGTNKSYTMTKTNKFKAKEFIKAVKNAQWPVKYDYDAGADWWLKKNAKKYGYKYYVS